MKCTLPLALTFLTVFPWPWFCEATPRDLARSLFWFPWVGLILGLVNWGAGMVLAHLFPAPAAAALLLTLTVLLTRGLHLDGLADTVDGMGGGQTVEARLAIMKDSRLGAFGGVSLVLVLLLKFAFLLALFSDQGMLRALILFPVISRWGQVLLATTAPYARPGGGLGQAITEGITPRLVIGATVSTLVLCLLVWGLAGLAVLATGGAGGVGVEPVFRAPAGRRHRRCLRRGERNPGDPGPGGGGALGGVAGVRFPAGLVLIK